MYICVFTEICSNCVMFLIKWRIIFNLFLFSSSLDIYFSLFPSFGVCLFVRLRVSPFIIPILTVFSAFVCLFVFIYFFFLFFSVILCIFVCNLRIWPFPFLSVESVCMTLLSSSSKVCVCVCLPVHSCLVDANPPTIDCAKKPCWCHTILFPPHLQPLLRVREDQVSFLRL